MSVCCCSSICFSRLFIMRGVKLTVCWCHFDSYASTEFPRWVLILTGIAHGAVILLGLLQLVWDAVLLVCLPIRWIMRKKPILFPFSWRRAALLSLCASCLSAYGVYSAVRVPDVKEVVISLPHLPETLHDFRIVQLSDLHISATLPRVWIEQVVEKVLALESDMILLTGDIIDGEVEDRIHDVAPLSRLNASNGVWACVGNHEYYGKKGYARSLAAWRDKLSDLGIFILFNEHVVLSVGDEELVVAGISDRVGRGFVEAPDIRKALGGAPQDTVRLLLAHRPQPLKALQGERVDLQFSGHTHGGQIWGLNKIVERSNDGFLEGIYKLSENSRLYVSSGAGLWGGFPLRLFVPSQITYIRLQKGE